MLRGAGIVNDTKVVAFPISIDEVLFRLENLSENKPSLFIDM